MKVRHKLILSTAVMGQVWPEQWRQVLEYIEEVLKREGVFGGVGLEVVAAFREPFLSLVMRRIKLAGLAERVEAFHGRVDYDVEAFKGRISHFSGAKKLEIVAYDLLMPLVGEAYRATLRFPQAKLLLHAPTLFQMAAIKGKKPRLRRSRLIVENDEKLSFPFGQDSLAEEMKKYGNPLNPVDVLEFVIKRGYFRMVFDTAHFWRSFKDGEQREKLWQEFTDRLGGSKLPIYWHMNHNNGKHFRIDKIGTRFASEHDEWLSRVCRFIGGRVKKGADQVCLEEPRRIAVWLGQRSMREIKQGIEQSVMSLREFGVL